MFDDTFIVLIKKPRRAAFSALVALAVLTGLLLRWILKIPALPYLIVCGWVYKNKYRLAELFAEAERERRAAEEEAEDAADEEPNENIF